jgi:hypothetical protein
MVASKIKNLIWRQPAKAISQQKRIGFPSKVQIGCLQNQKLDLESTGQGKIAAKKQRIAIKSANWLPPKSKTRFGANRARPTRARPTSAPHCARPTSAPVPPARPRAPHPHPTPAPVQPARPTSAPAPPARFNHCKFGRAELQKYQKIKFKFNPIVKPRYMGAGFQKSTICSGQSKKSAKTSKNFAHKREQFGKKVE